MYIIHQFLASERSGIYFKVEQESEIGVDNKIESIKRDKNDATIVDIIRLMISNNEKIAMINCVIKLSSFGGIASLFYTKTITLKLSDISIV